MPHPRRQAGRATQLDEKKVILAKLERARAVAFSSLHGACARISGRSTATGATLLMRHAGWPLTATGATPVGW